jgi:hypothetical protein
MEQPKCVSYFKKRNVYKHAMDIGVPPLLYNYYPIPIKQEKAEDLIKLVKLYVPPECQSFYAELPTRTAEVESDDEFI